MWKIGIVRISTILFALGLALSLPAQAQTSQLITAGQTWYASSSDAECSDWEAWRDSTRTLHVIGKCLVPTDGDTVQLLPTVQGISPTMLILERIVHKATKPDATASTEVPVHYTQENDSHESVQIRPEGVTLRVKERRSRRPQPPIIIN